MALVVFDRVQETTATTGTGAITLAGAVAGFQSFAVIGNGNTTFYCIVNGSDWEVGIGTYSTTGPTLARTTILANSLGTTVAINLVGASVVFVTYPAGKSVNLDASGNVSPLGTIASGVWNGTTIPVAYGGTGVTASSGADSVVLRDANQNIAVNRVNQANTTTTAAGGTTALTAASTYIHSLVGTGGQTYTLPDATTLTTGVAFLFNNLATGTLTIQDYATGPIGTIPSGGAGAVFLTNNATVGGTWDLHSYLPEGVTFGTNAFNLGSAVISGGTWQGGTIQPAYGGTGLTTFVGANNALYSTGASTLTAGTLPILAGGTGETTRQAAIDALAGAVTSGQYLRGNGTDVVMSAIQAADVPTLNQNTTGTASNVTGTVAQANGGTGFTTGYRLFQSEFTSNINANTNRTVGAYGSYAAAATNTPTTSGILYSFTSASDGSGDGGQFWQDYINNTLFLRQRWGGSYGGWTRIGPEFVSGTVMLFQQTAAPTGWTKSTAHDNKALRVVSGTAGSGGSVAFTTAFASQAVSGTVGTTGSTTATGTVGATTLTTAQIPAHAHSFSGSTGGISANHVHFTGDGRYFGTSDAVAQGALGASFGVLNGFVFNTGTVSSDHVHGYSGTTANNGSSGSHDHTFTGAAHNHTGGTFTGTAINLAVQYVDIIIATKN